MSHNPRIVTFYSYKGGVGRSMALANVAWMLAKKYKVIVIDWDLEAPGLHRFFDISQENIKNGLIDLFYDYKDLLRKDEIPTNGKLIDIEKYLEKVPDNFTTKSIFLLPAGRFDEDYATKVNNFNWEDFYENWHGYGFIEYLKEQLKEKADFILVDSRTGITDIGGICTIQIPDAVVLLFSLNEQNIFGIETICKKIVKSAKLMEKESPKLILIPARVEKYLENNLLNNWAETAAKHLGKYLLNRQIDETDLKYMEKNLIPYSGFYSFGENIVSGNDFNKDLAGSFENLMYLILKELGYNTHVEDQNEVAKFEARDKSGSDTLEFRRVLELAEKFATEKPENFNMLILKGFALYESNRYKEALKAFEQAIKINPNDEMAWYNKGNTLRDLGRKKEALKAYQRAIQIKPDYINAWSNLGSVLRDLGKKNEALKAFERAIKINPNNEMAWYNKSSTLRDLGSIAEALKAYERVIQINPNNEMAWYNKGNTLRDLGSIEEALKAYERVIQINPNNGIAWYNKGNTLRDLGKKNEALKDYERALEIKPDYLDALHKIGSTLNGLDRNEEALKAYQRVIQIKPNDPIAFVGMGSALSDLGRKEEALKAYEKAIEVEPYCVSAWYSKGNVLHVLGKKEDALNAFEKAIEIEPDFLMAWIGLGTTLYDFGRNEEALQAFKRANKFEPDRVVTLINMGHTLRTLGRSEEALKAYQRATQIEPDNAIAFVGMGSTLSDLGRNEEALKVYEKAIEIKPDYADAWYNLACINSLTLNKEKALSSLKRAIELNEQFLNVAIKDTDFEELRNEIEFKKLTDISKSITSNLYGVSYRGSFFGTRIAHFFYEKKAISKKMIDILQEELTNNIKLKYCLFIDSGTTTYPLFIEICDRIKKHTNLTEENNSWIDRIFIVTNNLPGIQYLIKHCRKEPSEYSDLLVKCFLLPGKPLPVYAAVAGSETVEYLNNIRVKKLIEHELNAQNDEYQIIYIMSANHIVRHPEKINRKVCFCPVARGGGEMGGHNDVKKAYADMCDKIYLVSPLTKFSFATCECLNKINGLTINEVETPELAKANIDKVKYREIQLTTPELIKKCNFVLTARKRKDIFGEFSKDIHEVLKLSYGKSKIHIANYDIDEWIPKGKSNSDYTNIIIEKEIPDEAQRNAYNNYIKNGDIFIWTPEWMTKDEKC